MRWRWPPAARGNPHKAGAWLRCVDPEELLRLIERLEATEFGRFRAELLAAGQTNGQAGGKFRDPAGGMFAGLAARCRRWRTPGGTSSPSSSCWRSFAS